MLENRDIVTIEVKREFQLVAVVPSNQFSSFNIPVFYRHREESLSSTFDVPCYGAVPEAIITESCLNLAYARGMERKCLPAFLDIVPGGDLHANLTSAHIVRRVRLGVAQLAKSPTSEEPTVIFIRDLKVSIIDISCLSRHICKQGGYSGGWRVVSLHDART